MKVLYDHQAFDMQTHGGVSRCFAELYAHRAGTLDAEISIVETDNVYLQALGFRHKGDTYRNFIGMKDSVLKHVIFKLAYNIRYGQFTRLDRNPVLNLYESVDRLRQSDFDIFHPTFFDDYFLEHIGNKPFVVTVHDMIPELFPNYFPKDDLQIIQKSKVIPRAAHVVTVSEQTRKDLIMLTGIAEDRVSTIYHGSDETPYIPSHHNQYDFEYILYVGERHLYKNFTAFCHNCIPILNRHRDMKIICTGKPFTDEEKAFFDTFNIKDRFIHIFTSTRQELLDLYHNAVAFVYPSEYEGFGIPILEAYKAGCPVLLNSASCFPEIAGDAAVFFRMSRTHSDFEDTFETFYRMNGTERAELLRKQYERLKKFSWDKSAEALADVYSRLL